MWLSLCCVDMMSMFKPLNLRSDLSEIRQKSIFMARFIYKYLINDGQLVNVAQRKKDFQLVERYRLRGRIGWLQERKLYGVRGFVPGRCLPESFRNKQSIFVISFHKNGTRSIHTYLEKLGFKGVHWPVFTSIGIDYEYILRPIAHDPRQCVEALAPLLSEYEFFNDVPFPGLFRELAQMFPKAKFILTYRPAQEWSESVWRHWRKWDPGQHPHPLSVFEAIQYRLPVGTMVTENDDHKLIEKYLSHNEDAREYFSDTGRLLSADLSDPDLNMRISDFLGFASVPTFPKIREGPV